MCTPTELEPKNPSGPQKAFVWNNGKFLGVLDVYEGHFKFCWSIKDWTTNRYIEHSNLTELDEEFYSRWEKAEFEITSKVKEAIKNA